MKTEVRSFPNFQVFTAIEGAVKHDIGKKQYLMVNYSFS